MSDWHSIPRSNKGAWLILLVGLLATGYFGYSVKSDIDLVVQRQFASDCDAIQLKIEGRLQAHKQVLLGGAALFDASDSVDRNEWHAYSERVEIDQHFNGIQGLGFSLLIPKHRLAQHTSEIRRQGFPKYTVSPAGERDVYSSIIYLEPFKDRNLRAFGYDMYSEPVRRAAMEQARDKNIVSLSGKVMLVQETGKDVQAGTLMYVPVYRKATPVRTVEQRRAALYGWVYSPFRMADLLHDVLKGRDASERSYLRLQVYDGLNTNPDNLLYGSTGNRKGAPSIAVLATLERHLDFNGKKWNIHFDLLQGSVSGIDYSKAWMILVGGASLSILSFFLMLSYLNTRRNAALIADELIAESRKASQYARSLIEASLDPLVTISAEGKITDVNRATEKVTGRSRSELIATDFSDYFTDPDKAREGYREVFAKGSVTDYPLAIRHWDGHITEVLYNASVYHDESGDVVGVFAAARDVTERSKAEAALRKNEHFLDSLIEHLPNMLFVKDAKDLKFVRFNKAGEALLGYTRDELLGKSDYDFFPGDQADFFISKDREIIARREMLDIADEPISTKFLGQRYLHTRKIPVFADDGSPLYLLGISEDITERKKADEQLRRSEHGLAEAQRIARLGNWELDLVNNTLTWSDEIYRIFEIDPEQFGASYQAFLDTIHPDDREMVNSAYADSVKNRKPYDIVHRLLMKDGRVKYVNEKCETYFGEDGNPLRSVGTVHDITAQKVAEIALTALKDDLENRVRARTTELEAANKELEAFSYSVSHDLRTPLRAIDGFSHILLEDYAGKLDGEGKRLLNVVRDNTSRMGQLIDDILKFSRAGRLELTFSEIDMESMAREVCEELRPTDGHELQVEIGHLPPAMGDRAMMRQVFVNLLSNAIKFSRAKEGARIEMGSSAGENETVYFVKDNGAGFDMQYSDKLFGVFQRLHSVTEFDGTGIGLAIVKRIVTRHGGRVWAEGKVNEGATVYFSLPSKEKDHG
ncbi:MAG: CHASE domain-containing protein [Nitrosomonadales bacterium]|nr:CHASE domain-containing protein [Nitrosomonadales bacterium]